jgi:predicted ATPase
MEMQEIHEQLYQILRSYRKNTEENLLFTYRKSNIGGFLDKGYYFLGNDNVVMVSFWSGINFRTRLPYINITINNDGQVLLEVMQDNSYLEESFISRFILPLFPFVESQKDKGIFHLYLGNTYNLKEIISSFIDKEKVIIDKTIVENESAFRLAVGKKSKVLIGPIDPINFKAEERKIIQTRRNFLKAQEYENSQGTKEKPIHFQSFQIENFSIINKVEFLNLPKENRWIFLTGENGSGKTLILRAMAIGMAQVIIPNKYSIPDKNEPSFKITLKQQKGGIIEYNREGNDDAAKYARTPCVKGFAAYGIFRHEVKSKIANDSLSKNELLNSILSDDKVVSLLDFNDYLQKWEEDKIKYKQFENRKSYLTNTLIEIVPALVDIHYEKGRKKTIAKYFIQNENEIMKLNYYQLSSGTRSILSLVADIFIRFYNQQPKIDDPSEFSGIVIIDEIDLHLHPIGQRDLVINLNKIFPNIQFIVSTHSPIPLLGAPKNSAIYKVIKNDSKGILVERLDDKLNLEELLPNTILTSPIFGMDDLFPQIFAGNKPPRTEPTYNDLIINNLLDKKIDAFLTDSKEKDLIERMIQKRKS